MASLPPWALVGLLVLVIVSGGLLLVPLWMWCKTDEWAERQRVLVAQRESLHARARGAEREVLRAYAARDALPGPAMVLEVPRARRAVERSTIPNQVADAEPGRVILACGKHEGGFASWENGVLARACGGCAPSLAEGAAGRIAAPRAGEVHPSSGPEEANSGPRRDEGPQPP